MRPESQSHPLLRFLDPSRGPIVALGSRAVPNRFFPRHWYSLAELHGSIQDPARRSDALRFGGAAWGSSRHESQEKAIVEAVERWAYRSFTERPAEAGLDLDPTSNGFAALPRSFDLETLEKRARYEALERWALNQLWEGRGLGLRELPLEQVDSGLRKQFKRGRLRFFRADPFVLCLFELADLGGVVPGSACDDELARAVSRAGLEALNHVGAARAIAAGKLSAGPTITDQRLVEFSTRPELATRVRDRVAQAAAGSLSHPRVIFSRLLAGPWEPEIRVHRVVVEGPTPITEGGKERFLI